MKKGFLTVLLSVLAGGLTAYGVVKVTGPQAAQATVVKDSQGNAVEYRTVNLADSDYPDFRPWYTWKLPSRAASNTRT